MKRNEYMIWYDVCIQILMYKIRYRLRFFFFGLFFFISIMIFIISYKTSCFVLSCLVYLST